MARISHVVARPSVHQHDSVILLYASSLRQLIQLISRFSSTFSFMYTRQRENDSDDNYFYIL